MPRRLFLLLLLTPLDAHADDCAHSALRQLDLDLSGISAVEVELASNTLKLAADSGAARIAGRACASSPDLLAGLTLRQERRGSTLVIHARAEPRVVGLFGGRSYAWLDLRGSLPAALPLHITLGSGDAEVEGIAAVTAKVGSGDIEVQHATTLDAEIGSGDIEARRIAGEVRLEVGSGDAKLDGIGALDLQQLGSGDVEARHIEGDVSVGSVGSGDLVLAEVRGNVRIDSVGSGDVSLRDIGGNLRVDRVGSGDVRHSGVAGTVSLPED